MASLRTFKPAPYSQFTTFVLAPTQSSYSDINEDLKSEMAELTKMTARDIQTLSAQNPKKKEVYPEPIFTGYSLDREMKSQLPGCIDSISQTDAKEIQFVFTAHGSPGPHGKIGMGYDDPKHPNYRVTVDDLITQLQQSGIEKLKDRHLHFSFRACNSAYVPLGRHNKDEKQISAAILEHSLIASFYHAMTKLGFANITVTGFRGFYNPGVKTQLSDKIGGTLFALSEGTISIRNNEVILPDLGKLLKIQNPKLDAIFQEAPKQKQKKGAR